MKLAPDIDTAVVFPLQLGLSANSTCSVQQAMLRREVHRREVLISCMPVKCQEELHATFRHIQNCALLCIL
jgi:hypothetical protein